MKWLGCVVVLALSALAAAHQEATQPTPSFTASTDLVVLHVTVKDGKGELVTALAQDAFTVAEGGRPQQIRFYTSEDAPVTVGLMLDNSTSMRPNRERLITAAWTFAESSNPLDELFALAFDDTVKAVLPPDAPFTQDAQALRGALTRALDAGGRTALFDGIAAGLEYLGRGQHERKVLVVVSDGGDNASQTTFADVLARTQSSNVVIYTVAVVDPIGRGSNTRILRQLADASGGEAFQPERPSEIVEVLRHIARDIRHTYTIGYESSFPRDGTYRKVSVTVRSPNGRRLRVQTRSGYLATRAEEAQ